MITNYLIKLMAIFVFFVHLILYVLLKGFDVFQLSSDNVERN